MSHCLPLRESAEEVLSALERESGAQVRRNMLGARLTTFAIGGPVAALIEPRTRAELAALVALFARTQCPWRVLGAGSNLLIPDRGVSDVVVRLGGEFARIDAEPGAARFRVGAAYSLLRLSRDMSDAGMSGVEFAGGIPGSLGGAVVMNAGAHGSEIAAVIEQVEICYPSGEFDWLDAAKLNFSYRHAELPPGAIVTAARLQLAQADRSLTSARRAECLRERKLRQPLQMPSAGSVFRNPSTLQSAGALIEQCGLKGVSAGGARISTMHANWIINDSRQARCEDVTSLIHLCRTKVRERYSIDLVPEVVTW